MYDPHTGAATVWMLDYSCIPPGSWRFEPYLWYDDSMKLSSRFSSYASIYTVLVAPVFEMVGDSARKSRLSMTLKPTLPPLPKI